MKAVKEVNVSGDARSTNQLVEGGSSGHVALAGSDPVPRYEVADASLEVCKNHRQASAAFR